MQRKKIKIGIFKKSSDWANFFVVFKRSNLTIFFIKYPSNMFFLKADTFLPDLSIKIVSYHTVDETYLFGDKYY